MPAANWQQALLVNALTFSILNDQSEQTITPCPKHNFVHPKHNFVHQMLDSVDKPKTECNLVLKNGLFKDDHGQKCEFVLKNGLFKDDHGQKCEFALKIVDFKDELHR